MKKKPLYYFGIALLFLTLVAIIIIRFSIRGTSVTVPASFKKIKPSKPAPANNFLKFDTIASHKVARPPGASRYMVKIFKGNKIFKGRYAAVGIFSVIGNDYIKFVSAVNDTLDIYVGLPTGISLIKFTKEKGSINIVNGSTAEGAKESFELTTKDKKLALGYIWQTGINPSSFTTTPGINFKQGYLSSFPKKDSMVNAETQVNADHGSVKLPTGQVLQFKKSNVSYKTFLVTSSYRSFTSRFSDGTSGYILHLFITYD